jgi:hypothetical protein
LPCDQIRRVPVVFTKLAYKVAHVAILQAALTNIGYNVRRNADNSLDISKSTDYRNVATYRDGEFTAPEAWSLDINEVKREYSSQVVRQQAKQYGWLLKESRDKEGLTTFAVTRR